MSLFNSLFFATGGVMNDDPDPPEAELTKRESALRDSIRSKTGYENPYDVVSPDSLAQSRTAFVDRENQRINLPPLKEGKYAFNPNRDSGQLYSHELNHLIHRGSVPKDSLRAIMRRNMNEAGAPQDSTNKLLETTGFEEAKRGEGMSEYKSRPQERFAYRGEDALRREMAVREDSVNHPTAEGFENTLREVLNRASENQKTHGGYLNSNKDSNNKTMMNRENFGGYVMKGGHERQRRRPFPENKLFLGGVTDAVGDAVGGAADAVGDAATWSGDQVKSVAKNDTVQTIAGGVAGGPLGAALANDKTRGMLGDAATAVGDFAKENPRMVGKVAGAGLGLAIGGPAAMTLGSKLGGIAGGVTSKATGDATGKGLKRKQRREKMKEKRAQQMAQRRAMRRRQGGGPQATTASTGQSTGFAHGGFIENQYAKGGSLQNMGQDAKKIKGKKHEQGGVQLDQNTEVEGGETMDKVNGSDYVFSERLRVPDSILPSDKSGMTFADYHEHLIKNDASQSEIDELAAIQERVAGRDQDGQSIGPRNVGSNKEADEKTEKKKHKGPLGRMISQMKRERQRAYGGERKMAEGGYYAIKESETPEGEGPKYPINSADDVKDAWKLRSHGDYDISQSKLESRIKRKAREYDVDVGDSEKAGGGFLKEDYAAHGGYAHGNNLATTSDDEEKMAYGGEKKYADGGGFGQYSGSMLPETVSDIPGLGSPGSTQSSRDGFGLGSLLGDNSGSKLQTAAQFLPAAANIGRALFEDSEVSDVPYTPPSGRGESTVRQMETDVDTGPQEAAVDKSLRSIIADPNASMNDKRAAAAQAAQQKAQIRSQAENKETGLKNQMLQRLSSLQQRNDMTTSKMRTQAAQTERRQQMKADAAQDNLLQTGLSQAANTFQQRQRQEDKRNMQRMNLAARLATIPPAQREGIMRYLNEQMNQ